MLVDGTNVAFLEAYSPISLGKEDTWAGLSYKEAMARAALLDRRLQEPLHMTHSLTGTADTRPYVLTALPPDHREYVNAAFNSWNNKQPPYNCPGLLPIPISGEKVEPVAARFLKWGQTIIVVFPIDPNDQLLTVDTLRARIHPDYIAAAFVGGFLINTADKHSLVGLVPNVRGPFSDTNPRSCRRLLEFLQDVDNRILPRERQSILPQISQAA